jgi:hypothetical protein
MKMGWTEMDDSFVHIGYLPCASVNKTFKVYITIKPQETSLILLELTLDEEWIVVRKLERNAPLKINGLRRCTFCVGSLK